MRPSLSKLSVVRTVLCTSIDLGTQIQYSRVPVPHAVIVRHVRACVGLFSLSPIVFRDPNHAIEIPSVISSRLTVYITVPGKLHTVYCTLNYVPVPVRPGVHSKVQRKDSLSHSTVQKKREHWKLELYCICVPKINALVHSTDYGKL